jgi:hypothetical protein
MKCKNCNYTGDRKSFAVDTTKKQIFFGYEKGREHSPQEAGPANPGLTKNDNTVPTRFDIGAKVTVRRPPEPMTGVHVKGPKEGEIINKRGYAGEEVFLVKFEDGSTQWARKSDLERPLATGYRIGTKEELKSISTGDMVRIDGKEGTIVDIKTTEEGQMVTVKWENGETTTANITDIKQFEIKKKEEAKLSPSSGTNPKAVGPDDYQQGTGISHQMLIETDGMKILVDLVDDTLAECMYCGWRDYLKTFMSKCPQCDLKRNFKIII